MKSRRQRCWAIRFLPANKFWRQEFTCHHHEISSLLIAWKYCINNVHWSLAQMWRNNGVVYGVFWVWWWQMIRDMYMVGRYGGRRSQMREHQKLCKLAYALRTVTHIPDPWDLNLYYGISVHIILTEFALFRSCTAGWPTSWFVCKKQVQNPKKIEENKFPFLTSNLLLLCCSSFPPDNRQLIKLRISFKWLFLIIDHRAEAFFKRLPSFSGVVKRENGNWENGNWESGMIQDDLQ